MVVLGITREDLVSYAFDFWKARFFADPHILHDVEVKGAVRFARVP